MARELHKKKNKELYAIYSQEPKIKKLIEQYQQIELLEKVESDE